MLLRKFLVLLPALLVGIASADPNTAEPLRIGWIGPMTGPGVKYGAAQAALMAQEEVNASGGVNGRRLELIQEDGKLQGASAISAFNKLTSVDGVKFIVGGHCTPESAPIAPLASANNVLLLAAITSSPKMSGIDKNYYRITHVSTTTGEKLAKYLIEQGLMTAAVVFEETDYVIPQTDKFKADYLAGGGNLVAEYQFSPGETDFRTFMTRIRTLKPQALYIGSQSPDSGRIIMKQLLDARISTRIVGNELFAQTPASFPETVEAFEGVVTVEPEYDSEHGKTQEFVSRFKARFSVDGLPGGIWTAEAYDAVRLLAKTIGECGEDVVAVGACLEKVKDYPGVSGAITIDAKHDGVRNIQVKRIAGGRPIPIR